MSVALEDGRVGKFTHATSSPVDESNFSISWSNTVVPSDEVKTKSEPSEFAGVKSESVKDISTGKSDKSDAVTAFRDTVILFRWSHEVSYQSPKASEGTRNVKNNRVKKDKIILVCKRSDRSFF